MFNDILEYVQSIEGEKERVTSDHTLIDSFRSAVELCDILDQDSRCPVSRMPYNIQEEETQTECMVIEQNDTNRTEKSSQTEVYEPRLMATEEKECQTGSLVKGVNNQGSLRVREN